MNFGRIALAGFVSTVVYFAFGGLVFTTPWMKNEFSRYPAVYRTPESMKPTVALGMTGMLMAILVLAAVYARGYQPGAGAAEGATFGVLIGLFAMGSFVFHNYVNLNIGLKLTMQQAAAYLVQWTIVGTVIGALYRA